MQESSSPVAAKRPRFPASKTPEVQKSDGAFEVSVEMGRDFSVYPDKLLEIVENRHESLINFVMSKFETGTPLQRHYVYTITRKCISIPRNAASDYNTSRVETYPAVSFANKQVLKEFIVKAPSKKKFAELEMPDDVSPMANPAFAELQSVRPGGMSWGFDRWGCISLHLTTIESGRLKHESIYTERKSIEVPRIREDEDVQIVEDPNSARR